MSEYISVKEFSQKAGVSPQAVYLRLDKDLKPYLKTENSRKMVSVKALKLFQKSNSEKKVINNVNKKEQNNILLFRMAS